MNLRLGKKIGEGGCSEVFEWENDYKIIKLAKSNTTIYAMRREYDNSRIAWENKLSVPQPFELVDINGRPGIVFERIYGETLMEGFINRAHLQSTQKEELKETDPFIDARITAQVLSEIHSKSFPNMSSQREDIKDSIHRENYLTSDEKEAVIAMLDRLPNKQQLCHGDPNPGNIIIRDGEAIVIDWNNATIGNPEADLAEYIILIRFTILPKYLPNEIVNYVHSIRESIIETFVDEYSKLTGITYDEIDTWIAPIAARKLSTDICEEERNLLVNEIKKRLR